MKAETLRERESLEKKTTELHAEQDTLDERFAFDKINDDGLSRRDSHRYYK